MNTQPIRVLAICGSTRPNSSNHRLIRAIGEIFKDQLTVNSAVELTSIPVFIPGLSAQDEPAIIQEFRNQIRGAEAVLICTPEYAHGVPGALKNAIDWTVGSGEFSHKPTALITASTDGRFGHAALLETLRVIECEGIESLNLLIQFVQTRINPAGEIIDAATKAGIVDLMLNLLEKASHPVTDSNDIA